MKFKSVLNSVVFVLILFLASCSGGTHKNNRENETQSVTQTEAVKINSEAQTLIDYLVETGDYANSRNFPSLIKASSVYEEINENGNIYIIDLRGPETFKQGHIKGAVRVDFENLPEYFTDEIKPFEYDKIVLLCYAGQISSYATSLLRLMGYGNVYSLRWGMSSWNKDFADNSWLDVVSDDYEDRLDTIEHNRAPAGDFPEMNTGMTTGEEILNARIKSLFESGFSEVRMLADKVFEQPENYYIINYDRRDKYEAGHVPGAVRYKPNGTLGIVSEMQTIPADKEVVVYCGTGHNSAFVTAYLRLFGYNAKTLVYGNNSFMHEKMLRGKNALSWLPFTEAEIENYPYEK